MPNEKIKISRLIGKILARVQDLFDRILAWMFGKLKNTGDSAERSENNAVRAARKLGGFIGEAGSEYYEEYDRLKAKKGDKPDR